MTFYFVWLAKSIRRRYRNEVYKFQITNSQSRKNGTTWDNRNLTYIIRQQGFQRLAISHRILLRQWDNQTKSSTNILNITIFLQYVILIFCNNTLTPSLFSRCCEAARAQLSAEGGRVGEGRVRSLKYNEITWDNRKLFYISHQQGFQRLSLSHCVFYRDWDNQTKCLFPR